MCMLLFPEQAEVGKVAATHEKEVYTKWQALKTSPDIEALEKLRGELTVSHKLPATL